MRPNIDLPWSIHGKVKDYAENENLSLDEAYKKIIESGLEVENNEGS